MERKDQNILFNCTKYSTNESFWIFPWVWWYQKCIGSNRWKTCGIEDQPYSKINLYFKSEQIEGRILKYLKEEKSYPFIIWWIDFIRLFNSSFMNFPSLCDNLTYQDSSLEDDFYFTWKKVIGNGKTFKDKHLFLI